MSRFKVGDIVVRTGRSWAQVVTGGRYVVEAVDPDSGDVQLTGVVPARPYWVADYFDLVSTSADDISQPTHYTHGTVETIDVIEGWKLGFRLGNCVKYISRAAHKGDALKDLRKCKWYLEREIAALEADGCQCDGSIPDGSCLPCQGVSR